VCLNDFFKFQCSRGLKNIWQGLVSDYDGNIISELNLIKSIIHKYKDSFFEGITSWTHPEYLIKIDNINFLVLGVYKDMIFTKKMYYKSKYIDEFFSKGLGYSDFEHFLNSESNTNYKFSKITLEVDIEFSIDPFRGRNEIFNDFNDFSIANFIKRKMVRRSFEIWPKLSKKQLIRGLSLKKNINFMKSLNGQIGGMNGRVIERKNGFYSVKENIRVSTRLPFSNSGIRIARERSKIINRELDR